MHLYAKQNINNFLCMDFLKQSDSSQYGGHPTDQHKAM